MSSRLITDLDPIIQPKVYAHLAACEAEGIHLLITCTYRTPEEQDALYAQGRTVKGHIVTNAKAGQSMHQYQLAYDVVPIVNGKPMWDTSGDNGKIWERLGEIGEAQGLEWAGRWTSFKELPHFQFRDGHPLSYFQGGGHL